MQTSEDGELIVLSKHERELEQIEQTRVKILKTRAEMWKYYISAITHAPCSDYELYKFLVKDSTYVSQLKTMSAFALERDLSNIALLFTAKELAGNNYQPLISSLNIELEDARRAREETK
jgi:3-methyladenine DNA glycosylase Mpg